MSSAHRWHTMLVRGHVSWSDGLRVFLHGARPCDTRSSAGLWQAISAVLTASCPTLRQSSAQALAKKPRTGSHGVVASAFKAWATRPLPQLQAPLGLQGYNGTRMALTSGTKLGPYQITSPL